MDIKAASVLGGCVLGAAAIIGLSSCPAATVPPPAAPRFQIAGVPGHIYVLDTTTGRVWEQYADPNRGNISDGFMEPKLK